jgi:hypothetical protein
MLLGLATAAIVLTVLVFDLVGPRLRAGLGSAAARARDRLLFGHQRGWSGEVGYDPGRERRAELRAAALLRSCVSEEEWAMYRDLGFLRVWGRSGVPSSGARATVAAGTEEGRRTDLDAGPAADSHGSGEATTPRYAYLIYPHKPIVAYLPETGAMLSEYCVAFPDHSRPYGSARLPDSDDVLAKWMALTADERRLIADANMHLPGRQIDPDRVKRDLDRLARWERERSRDRGSTRVTPSGSGLLDGTNPKARNAPGAGQVRLGAGRVRAA